MPIKLNLKAKKEMAAKAPQQKKSRKLRRKDQQKALH